MGFLFRQRGATDTGAPTPMPTANSSLVRMAQQRRARSIFGRSGRNSTVLTDRAKGTTPYGNNLLGQSG